MKRATIVVSFLLASGVVWASSQRKGDQLSQQIKTRRAAVSECRQLVSTLQDRFRSAQSRSVRNSSSLEALRQDAEHVSPEVLSLLEQFRTGALKELPGSWRTILDGSWDTSSTYVLLPKDSVMPALSGTMGRRSDDWFGMTPVVLAALGLSEEQADWIGHWGTNLVVSAKEMIRQQLRSVEPPGEALFRYVIPPGRAGFNQVVEGHKSLLSEAIGTDRAKLVGELLSVNQRVFDAYLAGAGVDLTVWRDSSGRILFETVFSTGAKPPYHSATSRGEVASYNQELPQGFKHLFPNGWGELLAKEGISLPGRE